MPHIQHKKLVDVTAQLEQIRATVTVAVAALKQQNCELDVDIAAVLQRCAADKLQEQIETLERFLVE